jgi:hypothetical protein
MIQEHLIVGLKSAFPEKGFRYSQPPKPVASLPSPCEALGMLEVTDDGHEATVYLTGATHSHFGCYEDQLSASQKEAQISSDLITFLKALFADRVVVWCLAGGLAGGWRVLAPGELLPKRSHVRKQFVWSRELT